MKKKQIVEDLINILAEFLHTPPLTLLRVQFKILIQQIRIQEKYLEFNYDLSKITSDQSKKRPSTLQANPLIKN